MDTPLIDALMERIPDDLTIRSITVHPYWITAESARHGMSCYMPVMPGITLPPAPDGVDPFHPEPPVLAGKNVRETAREYLMQPDILSRSIGHALVNSALPDPDGGFEGEAQLFFNDKVRTLTTACIGRFRQACQWRDEGCPVTVVELKPEDGDVHWDDATGILSRCDLVFITGLTLINGTFSRVIEMTPRARERVLFGPTVPLCDLWFDYGITAVGSTRIVEPTSALEFFRNGGTSISRAPEGSLQKLNITGGNPCGSTP